MLSLTAKPDQSSIIPYMITKYLALIGNKRYKYIFVFGNSIPNASSIPNTAPEAPTVGICFA